MPLIAHWPGTIEAGRTSSLISAFWDLLPTFCHLANVNTPADIDGISILPTLLGQGKQEAHPYLYWEFYERGGSQAVRMGEWKAVRVNVEKNPNSPIELYNLKSDPGETTNVANSHPEIVTRLSNYMKEAHTPSEIFLF